MTNGIYLKSKNHSGIIVVGDAKLKSLLICLSSSWYFLEWECLGKITFLTTKRRRKFVTDNVPASSVFTRTTPCP